MKFNWLWNWFWPAQGEMFDPGNPFNCQFDAGYWYYDSDLQKIYQQQKPESEPLSIVESGCKTANKQRLKKSLQALVDSSRASLNTPIPAIYHRDGNHWSAFVIITREVEKQKVTSILMKDSKYINEPRVFHQCIKELQANGQKIELVYNNSAPEQTDGTSCGVFALKNLEIMEAELKEDADSFIENFEKYNEFCKQKEIKDLRQEYGQKYLEQYVKPGLTSNEAIKQLIEPLDHLLLNEKPFLTTDERENLVKKIEELCSTSKIDQPDHSSSASPRRVAANTTKHTEKTDDSSEDLGTNNSWFGKFGEYCSKISDLWHSFASMFSSTSDVSEHIHDNVYLKGEGDDIKSFISTDFINHPYELAPSPYENHWDTCSYGGEKAYKCPTLMGIEATPVEQLQYAVITN